MKKMTGLFDGPEVEINTSSGMLSVVIHPKRQLLPALAAVVVECWIAWTLYAHWPSLSRLLRVLLLWGLASSVPPLLYWCFGEEIIEIDSNKLTIRRGIHGWERKREYPIADCHELEWEDGGENGYSELKCKVGRRTVRIGNQVSEAEAVQILTALQETLPAVAQQICTYPDGKEHFLTLGLNKK
jgi:hypothetical protein